MFSSPTRLATGTFTLSKKTSFTSCAPASTMIGFTVMPGDFMSMSRKVMPSCCFTFVSVRSRQKIQSAYCASVVHVFWFLLLFWLFFCFVCVCLLVWLVLVL